MNKYEGQKHASYIILGSLAFAHTLSNSDILRKKEQTDLSIYLSFSLFILVLLHRHRMKTYSALSLLMDKNPLSGPRIHHPLNMVKP